MSLDRANIPWKVQQIAKMIEKENISFDNIVQRSYVWEQERKSRLIESILIGYPIPAIYAKKGQVESDISKIVYDILDGKQRLEALFGFRTDRYSLIGLEPFCLGSEPLEDNADYSDDEIEDFKKFDLIHSDGKVYIDLNKKRFSELPLFIRNTISNFKINVYYFENLTLAEEREMFKRLNAGKPLTTKERNIANCADLENVMNLAKTDLIQNMFTAKGLEKKNYVAVIMKIWTMCFNDIETVSFESKMFNRMIEDARIDNDEMRKMNDLFDYIYDIHQSILVKSDKKTAKKLFTETHLVSVSPFIMKAMEKGYDTPDVANWFISFFQNDSETSNNTEYNEVAKAGSARPESIKRRNAALEESYNEFFANLESNNEENQEAHETINVPEEIKSDESIEFMNIPVEETEMEHSSDEDKPLPEE